MFTFVLAQVLSSCQTPDQSRFEEAVHGRVAPGMPLLTAVTNLESLKLHCSGTEPVDCSRIVQSLMPYSCVERVRLRWVGAPQVVNSIDIPKIACAGL